MPGIRSALEAATALRVYVCNVATQPGETEGYTLSEHLAALNAHGVGSLIDVVVANNNMRARQPGDYAAAPVRIDVGGGDRPRLVLADVVDPANAHRHDPAKLATVLTRLYEERAPIRSASIARSA